MTCFCSLVVQHQRELVATDCCNRLFICTHWRRCWSWLLTNFPISMDYLLYFDTFSEIQRQLNIKTKLETFFKSLQ